MAKQEGKQARNTSQGSDFSTWLNHYLEDIDTDLTALAAKVGISQGYLSLLRHGRRARPSREIVEALADVFGAPLEEALKAAGLSVHTRSVSPPPVRTRGGIRVVAPEAKILVNWSCQIGTGKVTLHVDFQQVADDTFEVFIKLTPEVKQKPTPSDLHVEGIRGYHVHLLTDGRKQAEVKAAALAEGIVFTLRTGVHEFRCQSEESEEEMVLLIPFGVRQPAELSSTEHVMAH